MFVSLLRRLLLLLLPFIRGRPSRQEVISVLLFPPLSPLFSPCLSNLGFIYLATKYFQKKLYRFLKYYFYFFFAELIKRSWSQKFGKFETSLLWCPLSCEKGGKETDKPTFPPFPSFYCFFPFCAVGQNGAKKLQQIVLRIDTQKKAFLAFPEGFFIFFWRMAYFYTGNRKRGKESRFVTDRP